MDPPDPDAMGIDLWDPTATAQGADSSSVESETSSEDVLKHFGNNRIFQGFRDTDVMMNDIIWTRDDNTVTAYYKYLLMIATVSGINEYGNKSRAVLLLLVLELYHDVPKKYLEMLMIAMRKSFPQWIHILPHTLKKDKAEDSKSSRFRLSKIYEYLASRASKQLVEHVCRDVDKKEKESSLFKSYLQGLESLLNSQPPVFFEFIREKSPFISGVNKAIHDVIHNCLNNVADTLREFLAEDYSLQRRESGVQLEDLSWENTDDVLLLYGVSGSGKTRSIERLLHKHWGYYLLPGNLSLNTQRDGDNLYEPLREKYSRDSCLLWQLIENMSNVVPGMDIHEISIREWSRRLILSRHLIFDKFLEVADDFPGSKTPANWLRFQKSCSTLDPFKTIFRLLLLVNSSTVKLGLSMTHADKVLKNETFIYCLDEAQCYLDTLVPFGNFSTGNLLERVSMDILLVSRLLEPDQDSRYVVSGTSLKLKKTISILESTDQFSYPSYELSPTKCMTFTNFPLLTNGHQLAKLIEEDGLNQKIKAHSNPDEVLNLIKERGIRLRGRYLWSARYVEHLNGHDSLDSTAISTAADSAMREAKVSLKKRLSRLRREKYDAILQELCWVVIQSDLLDRPTIFEKDEDHQMITEAFAVVETQEGSQKGTLKEYLAMDAAREWFREKSKDIYYGKFKEYLRFSTNDAGSFGKATEWFLALELWNCLHHSERMAGSEGEKRREEILRFLSKASVDGKELKQSQGLGSSELNSRQESLELASSYRLVEGRNIGYSHDTDKHFHSSGENPNDGSVVPIWEWMKSIRKKDHTSAASFYFPDNNCGPDIIFSLKSTNESKPRVLCVLQLKTGAVKSMEEALWTTDLWRSYKKDTEERKMLEEELENWKDATFIRILASTATKHQRDKIASLLKKEEEECEKLWKRQLFLLCDREEVITLFGKFFTNLIDARTSAKKSAKAENSQEEKLHVLIDTRTKRGLPEDFSGGRKGLKRQKR